MVVMIRLKRTGRRNRACFRLNAIEGRNPRDGRVLENLGFYDPLAPRVEDQLRLEGERVQHWVRAGAQLSETAAALCRRHGIELPAKAARAKRKRKHTEAQVRTSEERARRMYQEKKKRRDTRIAAKKAKAEAEKAAEA